MNPISFIRKNSDLSVNSLQSSIQYLSFKINFMSRLVLLCTALFINSLSFSQVVGSSSNSDLIPSKVEASSLSGGGYSGDVNVFNGTYSSSYPLGTVSTPGGLSYSLNLNYSPSYSAGESPSVCSGIPYGEGWHVNMPMITVSNAAYFPFLVNYECMTKSGSSLPGGLDTNYFTRNDIVNGVERSAGSVQGDAFWFSPEVSVPNVGSGRAVFKYIDQNDANCAVFAMNKFERYVEVRFYGSRWDIIDDAGNIYSMNTTLVTYRAPNNQRVLDYNQSDPNHNNQVASVINSNNYSGLADEVLNVIEPKEAYTSWYCNAMFNKNIPSQTIQFEYEKFGAFNYFQEFEQPLLELQISNKLRGLTFPVDKDYTAYTDIFLKKVVSNVAASPFEVLELDYELLPSSQIPNALLDPRDATVESLDSLYSFEIVYSQGVNGDFVDWLRYNHGESDSARTIAPNANITSSNPYLTSNNGLTGPGYLRSAVEDDDQISFAHGFLESPRINSGLVSGDIYEIRTQIADGNGNVHDMGNGTVDINLATGSNNFHFADGIYSQVGSDSYGSLNLPASGVYDEESYRDTRGGSVFSTFNGAVKWNLPSSDNNINTSNFFVMPNMPTHTQGINIQVGPGNSDTDYGSQPSISGNIENNNNASTPSAYNAYVHTPQNISNNAPFAPYADISNNFGIGLPWTMVEPLYIDQMGSFTGFPKDASAYKFWWNDEFPTINTAEWENEPTKFNESVLLQEVELVRYSKSPYMLKSAKVYRVNGEISSANDTSGLVLISNQEMKYGYSADNITENLNYRVGGVYNDTIIASPKQHFVYTLDEIYNIPVAGWQDDPSVRSNYVETEILQTEFEYEWYGLDVTNSYFEYNIVGNPGRRGRIMTKYIDQLGGETLIEYYPIESTSTLKESSYTPISQCASTGVVDPVIPPSGSKDIHPSVRYLTKLDENDNLTNTNGPAPLKRWEYIYDTTQIIFQSTDISLPAKFRNGYKKSYSKGFKKTTLYEPELSSGEQPYTIYEHHGNVYQPVFDTMNNVITTDPPTIEEYLYFGKPKSISQYNSNNQVEESTTFAYGYTKAHENGYERPNFLRDNLVGPLDFDGFANFVNAREYEYADYRKNQSPSYTGVIGSNLIYTDNNINTNLSFTFTNGATINEGEVLVFIDLLGAQTQFHPWDQLPPGNMDLVSALGVISGEAAKPVILQGGYLSNKWGGPFEKAAFLETYFYNDLKLLDANPDFYFHSYFIKTEVQKNRVYDNSCAKSYVTKITQEITTAVDILQDPFGGPYVNPVLHDTLEAEIFVEIDTTTGNGTGILVNLKNASPLSDDNLNLLISKAGQFKSFVIRDVLLEQPALSDPVLQTLLAYSARLKQGHVLAVYDAQPYISDNFQLHSITNSSKYSEKIIKRAFIVNPYLSTTVMDALIKERLFPQSILKSALLQQGQLPENQLLGLTAKSNTVADFVMTSVLLNQEVITDTIFENVKNNLEFESGQIVKIFTRSNDYPSDEVLMEMMDDTRFTDRQIFNVLKASTRLFEEPLLDKITLQLPPELAGKLDPYQFDANPYGKFCGNPIILGRNYIETVTEYSYYEAEFDGSTDAESYKKLMGLEDVQGKIVSVPYPDGTESYTLNKIELKHEPSWQLFKSKTYSPQYLGAFSEDEYYYYYDQMNRVSRHPEYYDWENSVNLYVEIDSLYFYEDTAVFNFSWPNDFHPSGAYQGQFPLTAACRYSQRSDIRSVAYQKTSFTKNNVDEEPLMRSEYYVYESRWNEVEAYRDSSTTYNGPSCPTGPGPNPCLGDYDCLDCFFLKYAGSIPALINQLPFGYCLYLIDGSYYACPQGSDPSLYGAQSYSIIECYPFQGDPNTISTRALPQQQALDRGFYLKRIVVQIDTISPVSNHWESYKNDFSNEYVLDFRLGQPGDWDSLQRRISYAIYPFDTLTVRTIDMRNEHTQVALEHNATGVYTKYYYEKPIRLWHVNSNNGACAGFGNYSSLITSNIGLPRRITVGYGRFDSLSTTYSYHPSYALNEIINPNGYKLRYEYDDYDRLENTFENERLLSSNSYEYWNRNQSLNFFDRTNENYVETYLYNGPTIGNNFEGEHIRAFVDPLGRNYSTTTNIDGDSTQVHSGTLEYDNWSRVTKAFKPYELLNQVSLDRTLDIGQAFTQNLYENDHKSRVLRNAKHGITDINDQHTVKQSYKIINKVILGCELDLSGTETKLIIHPNYSGNPQFTRVEIEDEDEKVKIEYYNAIGQKVGTKQYGDHQGDEIITLYGYDSYGNLTKVINPEKQETDYEYNILGQLFRETTVDAGEHKFMYNKLGLLSVEADRQGLFGEQLPGGFDTTYYKFYRVYNYDDYGRLEDQNKSSLHIANGVTQNSSLDLLFYRDTLAGWDTNNGGINGDYFAYEFSNLSTYDWTAKVGIGVPQFPGNGVQPAKLKVKDLLGTGGIIQEKVFSYGINVNSNTRGKIAASTSYDGAGKPIQTCTYIYNDEERLSSELITFNPTSLNPGNDPTKTVIARVSYPEYNYRGSLLKMSVDVHNDGYLDFQYKYNYDDWNRLRDVYANFTPDSAAFSDNLIAHYDYDDALGLLTVTKHYDATKPCEEEAVQTILYTYDVRDRLTNMTCELFDYSLYYDNSNPVADLYGEEVNNHKNWNGNINGVRAEYKLGMANGVSNPAGPSGIFDEATIYGYKYDLINRLFKADAIVGDRVDTTNTLTYDIGDVTYNFDKIGNFKNLRRGIDVDLSGTVPVLVNEEWKYKYTTGTNQLYKANGQGTTQNRNYAYDPIGNLESDDFRDLNGILYSRASYPYYISKTDNEIDYLYNASDLRIYKKSVSTSDSTEEYYLKTSTGQDLGIIDMYSNNWTWYVNGANRVAKIIPLDYQQPDSISSAGGAFDNKINRQYYLYDHLGNTRIVYAPGRRANTCIIENTIEYTADYYPYGKILRQYTNGPVEKFLTTHHERDLETGLDYRGARFYDSDVARFLSLDPLAADYSSFSDYAYVLGNPISLIDPTGKAVEGDYYSKSGAYLGSDGKNDDRVYVADSKASNGTFNNAIRLKDPNGEYMSHGDFKKIAYKVDGEATGGDETIGIAHAGYNAVKQESSRWKSMADFFAKKSTVKNGSMSSTNSSAGANEARAALIHALNGGQDPTNGAIRWDGTDFLAWGLDRPSGAGGGVHPKFKDGVTIYGPLYGQFVKAQKSKYPSGVVDYTKSYGAVSTIPAQVFDNMTYWDSGTFTYPNKNGDVKYKASAVIGETIFWKKNK